MIAYCLRLVTLIALSLMPFGAPAMAASQPAPSAQAGHCEDHQDETPGPAEANFHCASCTGLPAIAVPVPASAPAPRPALVSASVQRFHGIELEIATPPPKRA